MIKFLPSLSYVMLRVRVALKYHIIVFTTSVYLRDRLLAKELITDVANTISEYISIIENIKDPIML